MRERKHLSCSAEEWPLVSTTVDHTKMLASTVQVCRERGRGRQGRRSESERENYILSLLPKIPLLLVLTAKSDLWEVQQSMRGEWRFVLEDSGGQCVLTSRGTTKELKLSVVSSTTLTLVSWIAPRVCSGRGERDCVCVKKWGSQACMPPLKEKENMTALRYRS